MRVGERQWVGLPVVAPPMAHLRHDEAVESALLARLKTVPRGEVTGDSAFLRWGVLADETVQALWTVAALLPGEESRFSRSAGVRCLHGAEISRSEAGSPPDGQQGWPRQSSSWATAVHGGFATTPDYPDGEFLRISQVKIRP